MNITVHILLGSNQGNRENNIKSAIAELKHEGINVLKISPFIETKPEDAPPQAPFINAALECETNLHPLALLYLTQKIEKQLGRTKKGDKSPRPIDIDIAFYGDKVILTPELTIPHPSVTQRRYAAGLLAHICPEKIHPITGKTVKILFEEVEGAR